MSLARQTKMVCTNFKRAICDQVERSLQCAATELPRRYDAAVIRRLFTFASMLSLLLCVATLILWVRSESIRDSCGQQLGTRYWLIRSGRGRIVVDIRFNVPPHTHRTWMFESSPQSRHLLSIEERPRSFWEANGFSFQFQPYRWPDGRIDHDLKVLTPWWTWAALFSLIPATSLWLAARRRPARPKGSCPNCGYDLRASKSRCPECGTPIPPNAEAAA